MSPGEWRFWPVRTVAHSDVLPGSMSESAINATIDVVTEVALALPVVPAAALIARRRVYPRGCCRRCGYDLTGNTSGVCPECGKKM